jgi:hypothetical protein
MEYGQGADGMKKTMSLILAFVLSAGLLPVMDAPQAQADEKPVWTVAWIVVPEVNVWVGDELRNVTNAAYTQYFTDTAETFKNYIETHTNQAVEIQIDHIIAERVPTFTSSRTDIIAINSRVTNSMRLKNVSTGMYIDRHDYDTWIVSWPFGANTLNICPSRNVIINGKAFGSREAYIAPMYSGITSPDIRRAEILRIIVHEFLHLTEFWFRNRLGFPLPMPFPGRIDPNPLHNRSSFMYNDGTSERIYAFPLRELSPREDWLAEGTQFFYEDWLGFRILDPRHPGQTFGIPPEAWSNTPTSMEPPVNIRCSSCGEDRCESCYSCFCNNPFGNCGICPCLDCWDYDCVCSDPANPGNRSIVRSTTHPDTAFINLSAETITMPQGFVVTSFSTNGTSWRRGALPAADRFPRLLNNGLTLRVMGSFPGGETQTISFPAIGARPKRNAERLVPSYGDANWVLAKRNTTAAVFAGYEYAPSSNGRTPDNGRWLKMPHGGIPIASGSTRQNYLVRTAPRPDGTVAASVPWRVRPANFSKAPNYSIRQARINGSTDRVPVIAFRKGDQYAIGSGAFTSALPARETITVSELSAQGTELRTRRAATGRRPPSLTQTITLPTPPPTPPQGG